MRFLNADSSHTVSSNESSPLPSTEEESKDFTKGKIMPAVLDRKGEDKELFLHLLTLNCLQLKIILMLKWFLLGGGVYSHPLHGQDKKSWDHLPQAALGLLSLLFSLP